MWTHHPKKVTSRIARSFDFLLIMYYPPWNQKTSSPLENGVIGRRHLLSFLGQVDPIFRCLFCYYIVSGKLTPPKYRNLSKGTPGTPRLCGGFFHIFPNFHPGRISKLTSTFFRWLGEKPPTRLDTLDTFIATLQTTFHQMFPTFLVGYPHFSPPFCWHSLLNVEFNLRWL